ncbi:hypothetical protein MASR2M117_04930 [Paludibacter sp.]
MKLKHVFFALLATILMFGCEKPIELESVTVNPSSLVFEQLGVTDTLTATIAPLGAYASVLWESSDTTIVKVVGNDKTAEITTVGYGSATIKATAGNFTSESNIVVKEVDQAMFDLPVISIAELKALYTGTDVPLDGTKKIIGVVSTDIAGGNSTSLKNLVVTSEDNSSGIAIRFSDGNNEFEMGDKVEIKLEGRLTAYGQAAQIDMKKTGNTSKMGVKAITPKVTTIEALNSNYNDYEFCVVTVHGKITPEAGKTNYGSSGAHQSNVLTSNISEDNVVIFVAKFANFVDTPIPSETVSVTGILQRFNATKQLIVRNINDIKVVR